MIVNKEKTWSELLNGEYLMLLSNDELRALAELGYGSPVLSPTEGNSSAGIDALIERGFLSNEHEVLADFGAIWGLIVMPTVLGSVTRLSDADGRSWIYYVGESAFIEQTYEVDGSIFLLGTLGQLPGRVCLNAGLMRDAVDSVDPLDGFPKVGVKFTNLRLDQTMSFRGERTGTCAWRVAGVKKRPVDVADDLEVVVRGAMFVNEDPSNAA